MKTQRASKQIIVDKNGNSFLGFHSSDEYLCKILGEILNICHLNRTEPERNKYKNAFWVLDEDFMCVSASSSLESAMRYYKEGRILVHDQSTFV